MNRKQIDQLYQSQKWKQKRKASLRRDGYMCQFEKRYGKIRPAGIVHHIFPIEEYPEYALCDWNLMSVSMESHNKLHDRVTGELTQAGKDLANKIARQKGIPPV